MTVPLRWRALGRLAWHGRGTRRHDNGRLWVALGDTPVDTLLIIRPVASHRGDWAVGLVEQGTDLRAIIGILVGQHRRDDPPGVGIHADVELPPGPARAGAVLLDQPLTRATQLQARAVHQQVHGFAVVARAWPRHLQRRGPAA